MSRKYNTFDNSQKIERNSAPIAVSAVKRDSLLQKVNGDDVILVRGSFTQHILQCLILMKIGCLTVICKSSDNSNEDSDESKFPPVHKIRLNVHLV